MRWYAPRREVSLMAQSLMRFLAIAAVTGAVLAGCGDEPLVSPAWKAMCEAFCTRGVQCVPDASKSECVSLCLEELGGIPCEADPELLDQCVANIGALPCEAVEKGELPPVCGRMCTGGLCEGVHCDDGNECTDDICDPRDGTCDNEPLPDGAPRRRRSNSRSLA